MTSFFLLFAQIDHTIMGTHYIIILLHSPLSAMAFGI